MIKILNDGRIDRRTATDDALQFSTKGSRNTAKELLTYVNAYVQQRFVDLHRGAHLLFKPLATNLVPDALVHCFYKQRNERQGVRLEGLEVLHNVLDAIVDKCLCTDIDNAKFTTGHFVGVVRRQNRNKAVFIIIAHGFAGGVDRSGQVPLAEHNTLAGAGRAGGKEQGAATLHIRLHIQVRTITCLDSLVAHGNHVGSGNNVITHLVYIGMNGEIVADAGDVFGCLAQLAVKAGGIKNSLDLRGVEKAL